MIESLQGKLSEKTIDRIVINVQGVGYGLKIPLPTYYSLPEEGQPVFLHVHTQVKEDSIQLFGFQSKDEKEVFLRLMKIRGVGPRLSLNILSYLPVERLDSALEGINFQTLVSIPGVGKKMAERILFELRGIVEKEQKEIKSLDTEIAKQARSALTNLGFPSAQSEAAIREICKEENALPLEHLIKKALQRLTRL